MSENSLESILTELTTKMIELSKSVEQIKTELESMKKNITTENISTNTITVNDHVKTSRINPTRQETGTSAITLGGSVDIVNTNDNYIRLCLKGVDETGFTTLGLIGFKVQSKEIYMKTYDSGNGGAEFLVGHDYFGA